MNDFDEYDEQSGIEEWLDIGGPGESHGSGWGVDENAYTTSISMSNLSRSQIEHAERIAREIEQEQRRGLDRFNSRPQKRAVAAGGGQEDRIESAEDALELWRRKKQQEEQGGSLSQPPGMSQNQNYGQTPKSAPPGMGQQPAWDRNKEKKALAYLGAQLNYCSGNVNKFGNPTPLQAKNLLLKFGKDLLTCLPYPPPDIRSSVLQYFQQVGWDVRQSRPCPGSRPPNGTQIVGLVHVLTKYFSNRNGLAPPPMPILTIPQKRPAPQKQPVSQRAPVQQRPAHRAPQVVSHTTQQQRGQGKGKGGYQYQNNRGFQNRGNNGGYQSRNHAKGSYQQNRTYQNSNRQNYGQNNNYGNRNNDGFQSVGGNRRAVNHSVNHSGNQNQQNRGYSRRY